MSASAEMTYYWAASQDDWRLLTSAFSQEQSARLPGNTLHGNAEDAVRAALKMRSRRLAVSLSDPQPVQLTDARRRLVSGEFMVIQVNFISNPVLQDGNFSLQPGGVLVGTCPFSVKGSGAKSSQKTINLLDYSVLTGSFKVVMETERVLTLRELTFRESVSEQSELLDLFIVLTDYPKEPQTQDPDLLPLLDRSIAEYVSQFSSQTCGPNDIAVFSLRDSLTQMLFARGRRATLPIIWHMRLPLILGLLLFLVQVVYCCFFN